MNVADNKEIELLIKLKKQLIAFLDELVEAFPQEADFIIFRIFVADKLPITDIMDYIVKKLWTAPGIDEQDRNTVWSWFALFIAIGKKYKEIKKN